MKNLLNNLFKYKTFALLFTVLSINSSYAALSATTSNTIQGTSPYLLLSDGITKLTTLDDLLGFNMWDGTYESDSVTKHMVKINASMANQELSAPSGMKYSDVIALVTADGFSYNIPSTSVGDENGDAENISNIIVSGTMTATWYNGGVAVSSADLGNTLPECGGPYTLIIAIPTTVSVGTKYGDPNNRDYGSHSGLTYTFSSADKKICYLKPSNMQIYTGTEGQTIKYAAGYNDTKFDTENGFKVDAGFPTTGFVQATFSLIGSGNDQSKYRCNSSDNGGKVTLSGSASQSLGSNCSVTYNSTTNSAFVNGGTPTINMEYYNGTSWEQIDSYQIPTPNRWAISKGQMLYSNATKLSSSTTFATLDACRVVMDGNATPATTKAQAIDVTSSGKVWRQKYLYQRNEITNSPLADMDTYTGIKPGYSTNFFSRDVDGTFMGEWGDLTSYTGSGWTSYGNYWTADVWTTDSQEFYIGNNGSVSYYYPNGNTLIAMCRGE